MDSIGSLSRMEEINSGLLAKENTIVKQFVPSSKDPSASNDTSLSLPIIPVMEGYSDLQDTSLLQANDVLLDNQLKLLEENTSNGGKAKLTEIPAKSSKENAVENEQLQPPLVDRSFEHSFETDPQSEYRTAASPNSSRAQSDWATPKSTTSLSKEFKQEANAEGGSSLSDLSIPWSQDFATRSSPIKQILRTDESQIQDLSSVYFPGALGRNYLSEKSAERTNERRACATATLITPTEVISSNTLVGNASPMKEVLDASCHMDRVHSERTSLLLSRLQSAQEMYTQLQKELELERVRSQNAREELNLERKRSEEKSKVYSQEMEHVRNLVLHLNEQTARRNQQRSLQHISLPVNNIVGNVKGLQSTDDESENEKKEDGACLKSDLEKFQETCVKADDSRSITDISGYEMMGKKGERHDLQTTLQEQLKDLRMAIERSEGEKVRYECQVQDLDEKHYSVKLQLEEAEREKESMREQIDALNQQIATINTKTESLSEETQKQDCHELSGVKEGQSNAVDRRNQDGSTDLKSANVFNDVVHSSEEFLSMQKRLHEAKEAEDASSMEIVRLQEYAGRLESGLERQNEELSNLKKSFATLQQENKNLLTSIAESDHTRELNAERDNDKSYVKKKEYDELMDLAEQMQARIDLSQNERADERKRVTSLEKELSNRGITIVNLEKLNGRLEEDNLNLGIALSSKQQELSYLKRLGSKPLSSQTPRSIIKNRIAVRDLVMQSRTPITLKKENTEGEKTARAFPLTGLTTNETLKGVDDTQENYLPPLRKGPSHLKATRRKTIDGKPIVEKSLSKGPIESSDIENELSIQTSPASKAMPPPPFQVRTNHAKVRQNNSNLLRSSEATKSNGLESIPNKHASSSSTFSGGPYSSITGSRHSTSSMSSSISAIRGPMELSELTSSHN